MSFIQIRKFLTQDFDKKDIKSYILYIKGNRLSTRWMEKSLLRRELLLSLNLKCDNLNNDGSVCDNWININEKGYCNCSSGHNCNEQVIDYIKLF